MKIAIIGAGAIGGYVGVKLALAGEDVTFIVRGANLEAIKNNGMKLIMEDGTEHVAKNVKATNSYDEAGPQDMVILAFESPSGRRGSGRRAKLFGPDTVVVTMQKRHSVLVLPQTRRSTRRQASRASIRQDSSAPKFRQTAYWVASSTRLPH